MKKNYPLVSIVVPVYNVEPYLEECLTSIVNQTLENTEILIVDDASTDHSFEICELFARKDKRIKILKHDHNRGLSAARNTAIKASTGIFLGFVDSDDTIDTNMFLTMSNAMLEYDVDVVMCGYRWTDEVGNIISHYSSPNNCKVLYGIDKIKEIVFTHNNCVWDKLFRRELFLGVEFFEGKTFEDIFIMHELFDKANGVYVIDQELYNYRKRFTGITFRPFVPSLLDIIEAYLNQYIYIVKKYPNELDLIQQAGRNLFDNFLYCFSRAYDEGKLDMYSEELKVSADSVKHIDRNQLCLESKVENSVKSILTNIKLFSFIMKQKNLKQSNNLDNLRKA